LDELERKIRQLEIESEAIKRENDDEKIERTFCRYFNLTVEKIH
jgi:ATP-dependent Clp protease ATP-binding subunit ClpB